MASFTAFAPPTGPNRGTQCDGIRNKLVKSSAGGPQAMPFSRRPCKALVRWRGQVRLHVQDCLTHILTPPCTAVSTDKVGNPWCERYSTNLDRNRSWPVRHNSRRLLLRRISTCWKISERKIALFMRPAIELRTVSHVAIHRRKDSQTQTGFL